MKKLLLALVCALVSVQVSAALTRIDFGGKTGYFNPQPAGSFTGTLIADWDTGQVVRFDYLVDYVDGSQRLFDYPDPYHQTQVSQGSNLKVYDYDGNVIYENDSASSEISFSVTKFQLRNGEPNPVPSPEAAITLRLQRLEGPQESYIGYSAYDYWMDGVVEYATLSNVPLPAAAWLLGSALFGLGIIKRKRSKQ